MQVYKRKEDGVIFPYLQQNLKPQTVIIDIGARKGSWYKNIARFFPDSIARSGNVVAIGKTKA